MSTSTTNYNFIKDDLADYYDVSKINANLDLIDEQLKTNENEIHQIEEKLTVSEITLSNHSASFSSGVGKDGVGMEQNLNSIVEGQSSVMMKGFTANNLVKNGDFSNGTTGWDSIYSTLTVTNGIASVTANNKWGNISRWLPTVIGHKYYCKCTVKGDTKIRLQFGLNTFVYNQQESVFNSISLIYTSIDTKTAIQITDSRESDWSTFDVKDIMCIDLTATFGAGNEPTKEQCDIIFDHYIDGLQGTGNGKIVSVGKNLCPVNKFVGYITSTTESSNAVNKIITHNIPINKNKSYIVSGKFPEGLGVKCFATIQKVDETIDMHNSMYVYVTETNNIGIQILDGVIPKGYNYLTISTGGSFPNTLYPTGTELTWDNIQVEEGTIATDYEPYKSSEITTFLPESSLHRLPDGIGDSIEEINGIKTLIRKTKTFTLDGDETIYNYKTYTNTIWFYIPLPDMILGTVKTMRYCNISDLRNRVSSVTLDEEGYSFGDNSSTLYLGINQNRLSTVDLAGFKSWLRNNPQKITYELATPQIIVNNTNGLNVYGNLEMYPDGTIYQIGATPSIYNNAMLDITYNLSDKAVMMSNSKKITDLNKEKLSANGIANNLITTEQGLVLDARQGKVLQDQITWTKLDIGTGIIKHASIVPQFSYVEKTKYEMKVMIWFIPNTAIALQSTLFTLVNDTFCDNIPVLVDVVGSGTSIIAVTSGKIIKLWSGTLTSGVGYYINCTIPLLNSYER